MLQTTSNCFPILLLSMVSTVDPLKCYQCNSSDQDPKPTCDRLYWKQMSSQERDDLVIDCQRRLSFFCIVIRKEIDGAIITTRGCIGKKDIKGTTLNAGCVDINRQERACLCTDNLCNAARGESIWTLLILIVVSYLLSLVNY